MNSLLDSWSLIRLRGGGGEGGTSVSSLMSR